MADHAAAFRTYADNIAGDLALKLFLALGDLAVNFFFRPGINGHPGFDLIIDEPALDHARDGIRAGKNARAFFP